MTANDNKLHEDIGRLTAMVSAVREKLEEGNTEFRQIRENHVWVQREMAALTSAVATKVNSSERLEESVKALEARVDQLVALRHKVGGALFLLTLLSSGIYSAWGVIEHIAGWAASAPK